MGREKAQAGFRLTRRGEDGSLKRCLPLPSGCYGMGGSCVAGGIEGSSNERKDERESGSKKPWRAICTASMLKGEKARPKMKTNVIKALIPRTKREFLEGASLPDPRRLWWQWMLNPSLLPSNRIRRFHGFFRLALGRLISGPVMCIVLIEI